MELPRSFGVTVTQGSCNVFPSSSGSHFTLTLSFESLLTHTHNYVVWTTTHFFVYVSLIFSPELFNSSCVNVTQVSCKGIFIAYKWTLSGNYSTLFCVTVTQGPCNVFPLFLSGHSTLLLFFEPLLTHSRNYVVWAATHFFRYVLTHFFSVAVPFFLSNCYKRFL